MDIESRLRYLEHHYRVTLSAAVAAKAEYLAIVGEWNVLPPTVDRAKARWEHLDALKRALAYEMAQLEELEHECTT
jgi:hypothetical protein